LLRQFNPNTNQLRNPSN